MQFDKEIKDIVEIVKEAVNPLKIILFGSRAREDYAAASDFDLLVIVREAANTRALAQKIYLLLTMRRIKQPVDVIVESQKKFEQEKANPFIIYHQINKEGKIIYEAG